MPRAISVSRKYLPAWSHTLSLFSFHLAGGAIRKPSGGAPSAEPPATLWTRALVEKAERATKACAGRERASAINARGDDMAKRS